MHKIDIFHVHVTRVHVRVRVCARMCVCVCVCVCVYIYIYIYIYIVFVLLEQLITEHTVTSSKTSKKHKHVSIPEKLDVITKADATPNTPRIRTSLTKLAFL